MERFARLGYHRIPNHLRMNACYIHFKTGSNSMAVEEILSSNKKYNNDNMQFHPTGTFQNKVIITSHGQLSAICGFRKTNSKQAIAYLKSHGVRLLSDNPDTIDMITDGSGGLLIYDYESGFMSDAEKRAMGGNLHFMGTTNGGLENSLGVAKVFLNHPIFGHRRQRRRTLQILRY